MRTIFGREPAVAFALLADVALALLLLVGDDTVRGAANAVVLALAGLLTAAFVSVDAALPRLAGLIQAVIALLVTFGLTVPPQVETMLLAVLAAITAFFVRQGVEAKVPAVQAGGAHRPFGSPTP